VVISGYFTVTYYRSVVFSGYFIVTYYRSVVPEKTTDL
jgi:hypothetical protein